MGHVEDRWTSPDPDGSRKRVRTDRWGKGRRYRARWMDPHTGRPRSKHFALKAEAIAHLDDVASRIRAGTYLDEDRARATVGEYLDRWLASRRCGPNTLQHYRGLAVRIRARWGDVPVRRVTAAAVEEWLADLLREPLSASRVARHRFALAGTLQHAVRDQALDRNPVADVRSPKAPRRAPEHIEPDALLRIISALERQGRAGETPGRARATFALTMAMTGLRWGEAAALQVRHLEGRQLLMRRAVSTVGGRQSITDGKTHTHREVPLPLPVLSRVRELVVDEQGRPRSPEAPLFPAPQGGRWHHQSWRRAWQRACRDAIAEVEAELARAAGADEETAERTGRAAAAAARLEHTHQLRHTAATLAIAAGASVKDVQRMLGHAQASMTLDVYSHLLRGSLDQVADALGGWAERLAGAPGQVSSGPGVRRSPAPAEPIEGEEDGPQLRIV